VAAPLDPPAPVPILQLVELLLLLSQLFVVPHAIQQPKTRTTSPTAVVSLQNLLSSACMVGMDLTFSGLLAPPTFRVCLPRSATYRAISDRSVVRRTCITWSARGMHGYQSGNNRTQRSDHSCGNHACSLTHSSTPRSMVGEYASVYPTSQGVSRNGAPLGCSSRSPVCNPPYPAAATITVATWEGLTARQPRLLRVLGPGG
jgi:hypothetical protein